MSTDAPAEKPRRPSSLMRLVQSIDAEKAWAAENPALAADWDDALEEAYQRSRRALFRGARESPGAYLLRCGVGELEVEVITKGLEDSLARRETKAWTDSGRAVLVLHGGTGSGKTVAAAEALLAVKGDGFIRDPNAGRLVTANFLARRSYYDLEAHERDCQARLLVVDDIGEEQLSSTFLASLDGLMSERVRRKRRTILTTNLSDQAFAQRFAPPGSRLASRFAAYATIASSGSDDLRAAPAPPPTASRSWSDQ